MAERSPLSEPRSRRRRLLPKVTLDSEAFGEFAEAAARFNVVGIYGFSWDPYPFILLNLFFSTQASYSAPLILLAQNRQEVRDKLSLDEDRRLAAQSRADMDFLAREIAAIRMHLGELATRDFVRSELRSELRELTERLEQAVNEKREEP